MTTLIFKNKSIPFVILIIFSFVINCTMKPKSDDDSSAALLLLFGAEAGSTIPCTAVPANAVNTTGTYTTTVNASSGCAWVYLSLKSDGIKVESSSSQWDLALKRYNIQTNSGTSGTANGGACKSGSTNFASAFTGAECTPVVDVRLSSAGGGPVSASAESINPIMAAPLDLSPMPAGYGAWYTYSNTILTAKTDVYIITGSDGSKYALQMLDYYSSAGTSGYPKFQWKKL
ncbi:HmuY family protein [Leptospira sp. 96542]|nr:HmuY family protein [Leptospira sp. 96542]